MQLYADTQQVFILLVQFKHLLLAETYNQSRCPTHRLLGLYHLGFTGWFKTFMWSLKNKRNRGQSKCRVMLSATICRQAAVVICHCLKNNLSSFLFANKKAQIYKTYEVAFEMYVNSYQDFPEVPLKSVAVRC